MKDFIKEFNIKELLRFCVGGGSAVVTDLIVYLLLKGFVGVSTAKIISFVAGAIVGFVINKLWTFGSKKFVYYEPLKYCVLYLFSAIVNALVNKVVLNLFYIVILAWFVATGCSTVINFLGQKFFVFRKWGK